MNMKSEWCVLFAIKTQIERVKDTIKRQVFYSIITGIVHKTSALWEASNKCYNDCGVYM